MHETHHVRWLLLYWMPYDNNLGWFEQPIIDMLKRGVSSNDVVVIVQSDNLSTEHMSRTIIRASSVAVEQVNSDDSSRVDAFEAFLHWARERFHAEHWGVVFLGHGGQLDEFSPDGGSARSHVKGMRWMKIDEAARVIEAFRTRNQMELIFLQNCCKGTLEAHYTFRNSARYTLSSQTTLGAPNYYYEPALSFLSRNHIDGAHLATQIIDNEESDMYNGYVVTNNNAFNELARYLNPLISTIPHTFQGIPVTKLNTYHYASELLIDIHQLCETLVQYSEAKQEIYDQFLKFYSSQLIHYYRESPKAQQRGLSGLSVYVPRTRKDAEKYCHLDIYRDTALLELWYKIRLLVE